MERRPQAFGQRRNLRTLEVNLPVQRHQHLHRLQLTVSRCQGCAFMHKLVGEVLNCVSKDLESVPSLRGDSTAAFGLDAGTSGCLP